MKKWVRSILMALDNGGFWPRKCGIWNPDGFSSPLGVPLKPT